jgi:hypothetical protein
MLQPNESTALFNSLRAAFLSHGSTMREFSQENMHRIDYNDSILKYSDLINRGKLMAIYQMAKNDFPNYGGKINHWLITYEVGSHAWRNLDNIKAAKSLFRYSFDECPYKEIFIAFIVYELVLMKEYRLAINYLMETYYRSRDKSNYELALEATSIALHNKDMDQAHITYALFKADGGSQGVLDEYLSNQLDFEIEIWENFLGT